jgi:hypothetical protein
MGANSGVSVKGQFQRSVRLDIDFDRSDGLAGYVIQPSAKAALETIARHVCRTQQRAFTWTGPYGGGKSSLALAVSLLAGGSPAVRRMAREALEIGANDESARVFFGKRAWRVLPVVGRRGAVLDAIADVLDKRAPLRGRKPKRDGRRDVIAELVRRAEAERGGGVLLVLDELGKFLEAAAASSEDIYFYQELAEAASRCSGRLVVVGVLHQAFEQYASKFSRDVRDEWAKVQGRYVDIPIVQGSDEVIDLIGRAIDCRVKHPKSLRVAKSIAACIHKRRPSSAPDLSQSLDKCWPLHPVTAILLGPSSRRKFGQNDRSIFGFLSSAEPHGFSEFLAANSGEYFAPARYWDYLRANFENAILASTDGHRWAVGAEAVERVESRFQEPHVSLVKTIGLIELFRNGSGLAAEQDVLHECVPGFGHAEIDDALEDLRRTSILVYRKHAQAWGVFAGSDFDIDAAVHTAKQVLGPVDPQQLNESSLLPPITARRHYVESGTLRWFQRQILPATHAEALSSSKLEGSSAGRLVLLLPTPDVQLEATMGMANRLSRTQGDVATLYGVPTGSVAVMELASELAALIHVSRVNPELEGDAVARREIDARTKQARSEFENALRDAFLMSRWYFDGRCYEVTSESGLSPLVSEVSGRLFPHAPIIHSELVNRDSLSTSAAKAQRALMHRMLSQSAAPNLGYEGWPADAGLYFTVVEELGLHGQVGSNEWRFRSPAGIAERTERTRAMEPLWSATERLLESSKSAVLLSDVYRLWSARPFGVKRGVLPIIALAYLLANRSRIAVYVEGTFVPELTDAGVDEWLQDPKRISWKHVSIDSDAKKLLTSLAKRLGQSTNRMVAADPLDSARALVSLAVSLPHWTQRSNKLSDRARQVRTVLLRASDPVKVIFSDLPAILGTTEATSLVQEIGEVIEELYRAYPAALSSIEATFLRAIDHAGEFSALNDRAGRVKGVAGDFTIDALASRLQVYTGKNVAEIEGLVSLAVGKPPQSFTDNDLDIASLQLSKWALEFRRIEALVAVSGRAPSRQAIAVAYGGGQTVSATFDVANKDSELIQQLAQALLRGLSGQNLPVEIVAAALIEAGKIVIRDQVLER